MPDVRRMAARGKFAIASSEPVFRVFQVSLVLSLAQDTALGPIGEDLACSLRTGCCHEVHCLRVAYRLPATFTLHMMPQLSEVACLLAFRAWWNLVFFSSRCALVSCTRNFPVPVKPL